METNTLDTKSSQPKAKDQLEEKSANEEREATY